MRTAVRTATVPARRKTTKVERYQVPHAVIGEIVQHRLRIGGRIDHPAIEAPYGLFDINGKKVALPGAIFTYNYNTKTAVTSKGAELCTAALIRDFQSHYDISKLMACRTHTQEWENEEVASGKAGPFLTDPALTRNLLQEFSELDESQKKEIRFYSKIVQIAFRFLKMSQESGIIHTEHLPAKLFMQGPCFAHPETLSKGQAFFLMQENRLPDVILTELGRFQISSLAAVNNQTQIRKFSERFYSELNVIDVNKHISFSNQYPFMAKGEVKIKHHLDCDTGMQSEQKAQKWTAIRDFAYLLHKI